MITISLMMPASIPVAEVIVDDISPAAEAPGQIVTVEPFQEQHVCLHRSCDRKQHEWASIRSHWKWYEGLTAP